MPTKQKHPLRSSHPIPLPTKPEQKSDLGPRTNGTSTDVYTSSPSNPKIHVKQIPGNPLPSALKSPLSQKSKQKRQTSVTFLVTPKQSTPLLKKLRRRARKASRSRGSNAVFLGLAFLFQCLRGLDPGFLRYLQMVEQLDAFLIIVLVSATTGVVTGIYVVPTYGIRVLRIPRCWILLSSIGHITAMVFALKFTLSVYVQLIALSTPFLVALFHRLVSKIPLPPYTILAITLTTLSAFLTILGGLLDTSHDPMGGTDAVGMALALLASAMMAIYFVFLGTIPNRYSNLEIYWFMSVLVFAVAFPSSMALDDWSMLEKMEYFGLTVLGLEVIVVSLCAGLLGVYVIRKLGAPLVSTLLPWRLVVAALMASTPLLNENLNLLSIAGIVLMTITVFLYLYSQYQHIKRKMLEEKMVLNRSKSLSESSSRDYGAA